MRPFQILSLSLAVGCSAASTKGPRHQAPGRESHTHPPATGVTLQVIPAVAQAPLREPIDVHVSPGNEVFTLAAGVKRTITHLSPGRYTVAVVSDRAWAEPATFEFGGDTLTEVSLPVVPLSPPRWKTSSEAYFVVDVSHAEEMATLFRWSSGYLTDAHLTPYAADVVERLELSTKKTSELFPPPGPVPTIAFGPGTSMRRVKYAAGLLAALGYEQISIYADEFPPAPDRRRLGALPEVEAKFETDMHLTERDAESAFLREELWFRQCFAEQDEASDWVLLSLEIDIDGLVTKAPLEPGPSRPEEPPSEEETCSDYDAYMGECERAPYAHAPPVLDDLWDCLPDAARRLRFPVDEHAPPVRRVQLEVKGERLLPEPRAVAPRDELGK